MLAAGGGCGWTSRSVLTISRCSRVTTLAADSATRLHGDTALLVALRGARCRPISAKLVRHHSEGKKRASESRASEKDESVGLAQQYADENGGVRLTMAGASPSARSTIVDGTSSNSYKGARRMEWLDYQSMLKGRTGLLQRGDSVRGVALAQSSVGVGSGSRGDAGQPVETNAMSPPRSSSAPAEAAQGFGPPGSSDRVAPTPSSDRPLNATTDVERTGEGVASASFQRNNLSARKTGASSSPDGPADSASPISELERLFGKPFQNGGIGRQPAGKLSQRAGEAQAAASSGPAGELEGEYLPPGDERLHAIAGNDWDGAAHEDGVNPAEGLQLARAQSTTSASQQLQMPWGRCGQAGGGHQQQSNGRSDELLGKPLTSLSLTAATTHQNASAGAPSPLRGRRDREDERLRHFGDAKTSREGECERTETDAPMVSKLETLFGKPSFTRPKATHQTNRRQHREGGLTPSNAISAAPQQSAPRDCGSAECGDFRRVVDGGSVRAIGSERAMASLFEGDDAELARRSEGPAGQPRNGRARDESGLSAKDSHFEQPGSAWKNVHARGNLNYLLVGLAGDYGVQEMLKEHDVAEHTLSKLLPMFKELVMDDPDSAFPGEAGQQAQEAVSKVCYHPNFHTNAMSKNKPIKAKGASGRMYTFTMAAPGAKGGAGRFNRARTKLLETVFIPRLVELARDHFAEDLENNRTLAKIVDLRNPQRWYPLARLRKRRIIYHGGPTNSGKTYQAIERLKLAGANRQPGDGPAGIFCGPLRLLALEVYEQLNSQGVYCSLMTGQERREVPFATHVSCTIEMASTTNEYEVAVIDEIQMLADEQRGPSWTAALLGLNCPEIHVCGGMEGAVLVRALAEEIGDDFELKEYQRKTELVCAEQSLNNSYKNVQPGDAIVAFSRKDIFSIKREIESKTPHKCCVIYGSLPQETRAHQARLFNAEGTGYDVLVASDAIGMGLNLNIRRVVFHSVSKRANGGRGSIKLPPTMLKQIGGRAGRHGKGYEFGEVTCLKAMDMAYMTHVMNTPLKSIPQAGIFPGVERMQEFSNTLDKTEPEAQERRRLAETFAAFADEAIVSRRYFLGTHDQHQALANAMHPIENLTLKERYTISMAPVNGKNALLVRAIFLFAKAHAAGLPVFINLQLPLKGVLPRSMQEFQTLCSKHNVLDLYKWMGVRFPSIECFAEKSVAEMQRLELESIISAALKKDIAVVGPTVGGDHDSHDARVLKTLSSPIVSNGFSTVEAGGEGGGEEEEEGGEGTVFLDHGTCREVS